MSKDAVMHSFITIQLLCSSDGDISTVNDYADGIMLDIFILYVQRSTSTCNTCICLYGIWGIKYCSSGNLKAIILRETVSNSMFCGNFLL